jgi:hypothetical protein
MAQIIRFADYEQRSKNPDAVSPRNPVDSAIVIILPVIRRFNPDGPLSAAEAIAIAKLSS